jgi:hypothetical protein
VGRREAGREAAGRGFERIGLTVSEGPMPVYVVARYLVKPLDDAAARR